MAKKLRKKQKGGSIGYGGMLPEVTVTADSPPIKAPMLPEVTVTGELTMKELKKNQKRARKNKKNKLKIKKLQNKIKKRSTYKTGGFLEPKTPNLDDL